MARITIINPSIEVSFWGFQHALPIYGKRATLPVASLPLLAALTPPEHEVELLDENVEPIDYDRLQESDIVGLTGLSVQRGRMREILAELKRRGVFTVVGGPWVTACEKSFAGLADVVFVGEAEETWPQFLEDWKHGRHQARYQPDHFTDLERVPVPRHDLLAMDQYLFGSVQMSRGCPFQCEFCDIAVTQGHRVRLKRSEQVIAELESLRRLGLEIVFLVDDNIMGDRRAMKPLLGDLAAWQKAHGYPMAFFVQASINLAEDAEMLRLLVETNVIAIFVGVESPNVQSLQETGKLQNVRKGVSLADRVRTIQQAGIEVWAGMVLGFDHDDAGIFAAHRQFAHDARLTYVMLGMLSAIPGTPLSSRLAAEGRLDPDQEAVFGTNVVPLGMSRETLRDGFIGLMCDLYQPNDYFSRFEALYLHDRIPLGRSCSQYWHRHPWRWLQAQTTHLLRSAALYRRLMRRVPDPGLRQTYRRCLRKVFRFRPDPVVIFMAVSKCIAHYHYYTMARRMADRQTQVCNTY